MKWPNKTILVPVTCMVVLTSAVAVSAEPDSGIDSAEDVVKAVDGVLDSERIELPTVEALGETEADPDDLVLSPNDDETLVAFADNDEDDQLTIPASSADPISLTGEDGDPIDITLPGDATPGTVTDDGEVVYQDVLPASDLLVQAQEDGGVRILAVLESAAAPDEFTFDLGLPDDAQPIQQGDGSIVVLDEDKSFIAYIPPPWAYDADDQRVPASYSLDGSELVLRVDHSATDAYPVVADPQVFETQYGLVLRLTLKELADFVAMLSLVGNSMTAVSILVGLACFGTTNVPCAAGAAVVAVAGLLVSEVTPALLQLCSGPNGVDLHFVGVPPDSPFYPGIPYWCTGW